jgi:hypothetical protein
LLCWWFVHSLTIAGALRGPIKDKVADREMTEASQAATLYGGIIGDIGTDDLYDDDSTGAGGGSAPIQAQMTGGHQSETLLNAMDSGGEDAEEEEEEMEISSQFSRTSSRGPRMVGGPTPNKQPRTSPIVAAAAAAAAAATATSPSSFSPSMSDANWEYSNSQRGNPARSTSQTQLNMSGNPGKQPILVVCVLVCMLLV